MSDRRIDPLKILDCVNRVQRDYFDYQDQAGVFDYLLSELLQLTHSEYGFIGEVLEDDSGRFLKTRAITNIAWDAGTHAWYAENAPSGLEFRNLDSLFGRVIRDETLLLANEPDQHPDSAGRPSGHPPLTHFAGIPLHHGGRFIGMAGIANRPGGYDALLVDELAPLLTTMAQLLLAFDQRRELEIQRQRLNHAFEATSDGIWEWVPATERYWVSARWMEMLGRSPADHDDAWAVVLDVLHPEDRDNLHRDMDAHLEGRTPRFESRFRMRHADGHDVWILARGRVVAWDADGKPTKMVGTHQDITQQRIQEEQLTRAKEAAESATRAKALFLANLSHEIRTPLNGVVSAAHLLDDGTLREDQAALVQMMTTAGQGLLGIVTDVLDLSRIEAGELRLEATDFAPRRLIADVARIHHLEADRKGLELHIDLDPDTPERAVGDPTRLQQVLHNLLANAIKFTERGHVRLQVGRRADPDGVRLALEVSDTGIGIAPEHQSRIFRPFHQAEASTTRRFGGTGLGLAVSHRIVDAMHGTLTVESVAGQGSTFRFDVLLGHAQVQAPAAGSATGLVHGRGLVVEDNPVNQVLLVRLIQRYSDCEVDTADNGLQALDRLAEADYDLVFMDLQMPALDGLQTTRALRSGTRNRDVVVVAQTANAFTEDREACLDAGMNDFLSKPVQPDILRRLLGRWLGDEVEAAA